MKDKRLSQNVHTNLALTDGFNLDVEDGSKWSLRIRFDTADTEQEGVIRCRIARGILASKDFIPESGKEYKIYECKRFFSKEILKELGIEKGTVLEFGTL